MFNLIVGAGALSLPQAFAGAGYIAGAALLILLSFLSFMAVTFMVSPIRWILFPLIKSLSADLDAYHNLVFLPQVEAMSLGNALSKTGAEDIDIQTSPTDERKALLSTPSPPRRRIMCFPT